MKLRYVVVPAIMVMALSSSAWAAGLRVKIPFDFTVLGKQMPAGQYMIETETPSETAITIRNMDTGAAIPALTETRLAERPNGEALVVFDKADGVYYLSEVHPGVEDGYLLRGAPGKHTHAKVPVQK